MSEGGHAPAFCTSLARGCISRIRINIVRDGITFRDRVSFQHIIIDGMLFCHSLSLVVFVLCFYFGIRFAHIVGICACALILVQLLH